MSSQVSLVGQIRWLRPKDGYVPSGKLKWLYRHPVLVLSESDLDGNVEVLTLTSFDNTTLTTARRDNPKTWEMYLPIWPSDRHPDNNKRLKMANKGKKLDKNSYVKLETIYVVPRRHIEVYNESKPGDVYRLHSNSMLEIHEVLEKRRPGIIRGPRLLQPVSIPEDQGKLTQERNAAAARRDGTRYEVTQRVLDDGQDEDKPKVNAWVTAPHDENKPSGNVSASVPWNKDKEWPVLPGMKSAATGDEGSKTPDAHPTADWDKEKEDNTGCATHTSRKTRRARAWRAKMARTHNGDSSVDASTQDNHCHLGDDTYTLQDHPASSNQSLSELIPPFPERESPAPEEHSRQMEAGEEDAVSPGPATTENAVSPVPATMEVAVAPTPAATEDAVAPGLAATEARNTGGFWARILKPIVSLFSGCTEG